MGLPTSRDQTVTNASPVPSALLNNLQDQIIGNKHPQLELDIDASKGRPDNNAGGSYNPNGYWSTFVGAGTVRIPIEVPVGKRIVSVECFYSINGTGAGLTPRLRRQNHAAGTITSVVSGANDNTGGAGVIESQVLSANHTVLTGEAYFVEFTVANANHRAYGIKVLFDAL